MIATKCYIYLKKDNNIIMIREYRQLWNESGTIKGQRYSEKIVAHYKGLISLKKGIMQGDSPNQDKYYFTFELKEDLFFNDQLKAELTKLLVSALKELLIKNNYTKKSKVLAVGLGNEKMSADALGAITVSALQVTRHLFGQSILNKAFNTLPNLSAIKSSVSGVTGLNSFDIIKGVIDRTKPDIVIAIDTLACKNVSRLSRCVQLSDEGIEPGGGVDNAKEKLTNASLGIPIIAIGVPLVIYVKDIIKGYIEDERVKIKTDKFLHTLIVTAKEIDFVVQDYGYILADCINQTLNQF